MSETTTWWRAHYKKIEPVQVEKHTEQSVWIDGRRRAKSSGGFFGSDNYYPTWVEARDALLKEAEASVNNLRRQLDLANGHLGNVKGWKEPAP